MWISAAEPVGVVGLEDPDPRARSAAALSLDKIVDDAKRVVDALTAKLGDSDGRVRTRATAALEHLRVETR